MATKPLGMGRKLGAAVLRSPGELTSSLARTGWPALITTSAKYCVLPERSATAEKCCGGASADVILVTCSEPCSMLARAGMSALATTTETSPDPPLTTSGAPPDRCVARKMNAPSVISAISAPRMVKGLRRRAVVMASCMLTKTVPPGRFGARARF